MPYDLSGAKQVKDMFGTLRHYRGTILRARLVGMIPALVKDGHTILNSMNVWDFLVRTKRGRYMVVRGDFFKEGQPFGGDTSPHAVEDWWTVTRRKDAEVTFEKLAKLAEPASADRGGGAAWGGYYHTQEEFERAKASGEVNNK